MTDNPSAFPSEGEGHGNPRYHSPGMTLRDWFAGQAVAGRMANPSGSPAMEHADALGIAEIVAEECYLIADAMLAARATIAKASPPGEGM
jgi:hypothetical protein